MENIIIRRIEEKDNTELAKIIRDSLSEFGANKPGTVYYDPTTDHLSDVFTVKGSVYYIAEKDGELLGGAGLYPTEGLPEDTCELVKMYLKSSARGMGLGRFLIDKCLQSAREMGYKNVYLETMPELRQAVKVYEKFGFGYLNGPMGNSGHFGCDRWMLKKLDAQG